MIEELKKLGWPVIIGCHVGETSLLTRAALVVSGAAGESLIAHEGHSATIWWTGTGKPDVKIRPRGSAGFEFSLLSKDGSGTSGYPDRKLEHRIWDAVPDALIADDDTPGIHFLKCPTV